MPDLAAMAHKWVPADSRSKVGVWGPALLEIGVKHCFVSRAMQVLSFQGEQLL